MPYSPRTPALFALDDLSWAEDDGMYRVIDVTVDQGTTMVVVESPHGEAELMSVTDVIHAKNRDYDPVASAKNLPRIDPLWSGVSAAKRARWEKRYRDLTLMATGRVDSSKMPA